MYNKFDNGYFQVDVTGRHCMIIACHLIFWNWLRISLRFFQILIKAVYLSKKFTTSKHFLYLWITWLPRYIDPFCLSAYAIICHFQSVQLDRLALYLDSDISPWHVNKPWEDLLPSEWVQVYAQSSFSNRGHVPACTYMHIFIYYLFGTSGF